MRWFVLLLLASCATQQVALENVTERADTIQMDTPAKLSGILNAMPTSYSVNYTQANDTIALTVVPEGSRIDIVGNYTTRVLQTNITVTCSKEDSWTCFQLEAARLPTGQLIRERAQMDTIQVLQARTRSVLGIRTDCFLLYSNTFVKEVCYSKDNLPLYIEERTATTHRMWRAMSYNLNATLESLEPPAPAKAVSAEVGSLIT